MAHLRYQYSLVTACINQAYQYCSEAQGGNKYPALGISQRAYADKTALEPWEARNS